METNATFERSLTAAPVPAAWPLQCESLPWYVVYVRSRHEFAAYTDLLRRGLVAFLPTVVTINRWKDRKKRIEAPLFPGYVFVQLPQRGATQLAVLQARGVVAFVALEQERPTPVAPEDIAALRLMIDSGRTIDLYPDMQTGVRVRIKSGPLKNAVGIVSAKGQDYQFHVNIELLGRSVAVSVSAQDLETA